MGQLTGTITAGSIVNRDIAANANIDPAKIAQRVLAVIPISLLEFRIWDALQTNLTTPASDDLGIATGTFGSGLPYISAGDLKAAGSTTRRARVLVRVPEDYDPGETILLRAYAGMTTHVADASCTIDFEVYQLVEDNTLSADLVSTSATSMNSLTVAPLDFIITGTGLTPGDVLDVRMTVACNDAASATAVIPTIIQVALLADLR